jgi:hypothetical protein
MWLDEGCPGGRADAHWDIATELMAIQDNQKLTLKPVDDGRTASSTGEPVEPLIAVRTPASPQPRPIRVRNVPRPSDDPPDRRSQGDRGKN